MPIYSDDLSIENSFTSSTYHAIGDNLILSANFYLKAINSLEDNVRVSKRVTIPSRRLRGLKQAKLVLKMEPVYRGNYTIVLNLSSTLPNIFFEKENIDLNFLWIS